MSKWNPNAYPRRVLLNQRQIAQLFNERRTLNEWHVIGLFARAMFGPEVRRLRFESSPEGTRQFSAINMDFKPLEPDLGTDFWCSTVTASRLYAEAPSPNLVQDITTLWLALLPELDDDWERHEMPPQTFTGMLAIPSVLEAENAYAEALDISLAEYQQMLDRFTRFFPKAPTEPGLFKSIGHFHWQYRTGQLSIEVIAERLNVFVFDLAQLWMKHDLEVYPEGAKGDYLVDPERLARYLKVEIGLYVSEPVQIEYNEVKKIYSLWSEPRSAPGHKHVFMQAQIKANRIVITIDHTDKPLFEALLHAGIPREQMVFAYRDETRPLTYNPPEGG